MFRFESELFRWEGDSAWHFLALPEAVADAIEDRQVGGLRRGFGSVRVRVTIGGSTWATSVFPDKGRRTFLLPVKAAVRKAEGLDAGDVATVVLELVDVVDRP